MGIKPVLAVLCMAVTFIFANQEQPAISPSGDEVYIITVSDDNEFIITGTHAANSNTLVSYQTVGFTFSTGATNGNVTDYMKSGDKYYTFNYGEDVSKYVKDNKVGNEVVTTYTFPQGMLFTMFDELGINNPDDLKNGVSIYISNLFMVKNRESAKDDFSYTDNKVYFDKQEIINAQSWNKQTKEKLPHYYDMKISIKLTETITSDPLPDQQSETEEAVNQPDACLKIGADERHNEKYDIVKGIPGGESIYVNVFAMDALFSLKVIKRTGTRMFTVTVNKTYDITWLEKIGEDTDGKEIFERQYDTVSKKTTEILDRKFSYNEIGLFEYYIMNDAIIETDVINESIVLKPGHEYELIHGIEYEHSSEISDHIIQPETNITIYGGIIDGGYERPHVHSATKDEADRAFGELKVRNDSLSIGGVTVLDGTVCYQNAPDQSISIKELTGIIDENVLYQSGIRIPDNKQNGQYEVSGVLTYKRAANINSGSAEELKYALNSGKIRLHTPVVCNGLFYSDNDRYVQLVNPEKEAYHLVLSENRETSLFSVVITNFGAHLGIKGYGVRDYSDWTRTNQIRFPFDVCINNKDGDIVKSNTWIDMSNVKCSYFIPLWVDEGCYDVEFRSVAINADGDSGMEPKANLNIANAIATDSVRVQISGSFTGMRLYDKDKRIHIGEVRKLGETTQFSFETIGSFSDINSSVELKPIFYYINADRSERYEINIYYVDENDNSQRRLIRVGSDEDAKRMKIYNSENNGLNIPQEEQRFTALLSGMSFNNFRMQKRALFYYGGIHVPWILRSFINQPYYENLSDNQKKYLILDKISKGAILKRKQRWYGEYYLPENCMLVKKGCSIYREASLFGINIGGLPVINDMDAGGYIAVNFRIHAKDTKERFMLDYVNEKNHIEQGHCSMWENDMIAEMVLNENGNTFKLYPGDLFIYDTTKLIQDEYTREVTH